MIEFIIKNKILNRFFKFLREGSFLLVWFKWFMFANLFAAFLLIVCTPLPIDIRLCKAMLAINAYTSLISSGIIFSSNKEGETNE
jgi:hypothetical protein